MKISWIESDVLAASGIPVSRENLQSLVEQGIRAIVTLTEHSLTVQREITVQVLDDLGLICLHAPIVDQYPPDVATIQQVREFINQMKAKDQPVLVHCHAGIGRTGTILHAYYLTEDLSLEDAKIKVKNTRLTSQFFMLSDRQQAFLKDFAEKV